MQSKLRIEIGMPLLAQNNLSESALLKVIGDDRWRQLQALGGVPTSLIRDESGIRLYATFYFLELNFSRAKPLSAYRENDLLEFHAEFGHHMKSYLDGRHVVSSNPDVWVRTSNVFIHPEGGPTKLAVSFPANVDFENIPEMTQRPDSLDLCRQAKTKGAFFLPEPDDVPLFEGSREYVYEIDADRDLNSAGLVYFANFISFLNLAERRILTSLAAPVPAGVIDARSTYYRRVGFYGNAREIDRLGIRMQASARVIENGKGRSADFSINHIVRRLSDEKEIVISSCRKVAPLPVGTEVEMW